MARLVLKKKEKKVLNKLKRAAVETNHRTLEEAVLADIIDVIPVAGDISNALRVINAAARGEDRALLLQAGDLVIGAVPIIGTVGDLLTPSNVAIYVLRKRKLNKKIKKLEV